jgi:ferric-dicitrate binding protein FerR (iron transport regulator)
MQKIDFRLLKNFTEGKYSFRDFQRISSWFADSSLRSELESAIGQHWNEFPGATDEPKKDLSFIYDQLREQIRREQPETLSLQKRMIRLYSQIAAVLLLPLLIYTTFILVGKNAKTKAEETAWAEIYAPPGSRTSFMLPDGSKGWLNSGTKLKYPLNFKHNRQLSLVGEAYFEVTKNKDLPLTITTSNLDVKVLGTTFSISALADENTTDVILEEGSVEIDNPGIGLKTVLKPDQKLVFDNLKHEYQTTSLNAQQYNAWKDGLLIFRNEPLADVFKRLSRWYNVKITITDDQIKRYKYRATFRNEPIEEVIRLIAMTLPIEYKIQKRAYDEQGIYAVREIVIMKK